MKKLLLASSALVLTAGYAAAEVTLNGDGYMGLLYSEPDDIFTNSQTGDSENWVFVYDLDFQFVGTGETDGGLIFGAELDADDAGGAQGTQGFEGTMFIQGEFGKLSMGDTDGGAEAIIGDLAGVGLSGLGDFNENIFLLASGDPNSCDVTEESYESAIVEGVDNEGNTVDVVIEDAILSEPGGDIEGCGTGPLALYEYSTGGFSLALGVNDDEGYSVAAGYASDFWSLGVGYESILEGAAIEIFDTDFPGGSYFLIPEDDTDQIIGAASVSFADVTLKGIYGHIDAGDEVDQWGVSAESTIGLTTVSAYYREIDPDVSGISNSQFYGVGASYDLGGGAALVAGVIYADIDTGDCASCLKDEGVFADFGLAFNF